jgi:hypothetical protein
MEGRSLPCRFEALDFLAATPPGGPFQFVFDRGCFHVFDEPDERQRFAARVAAALAPGGLWLSLIGSTEGSSREVGPPRRSAVEVILAIEPALEVVELRSAEFHGSNAKAWFCLSRQRTTPAQPSTRHYQISGGNIFPALDECQIANSLGEQCDTRLSRFLGSGGLRAIRKQSESDSTELQDQGLCRKSFRGIPFRTSMGKLAAGR